MLNPNKLINRNKEIKDNNNKMIKKKMLLFSDSKYNAPKNPRIKRHDNSLDVLFVSNRIILNLDR